MSSETVSISRISSLPIGTLGEAPHWDQDSQSLVYVDAPRSQVHRYFPDTDKHQALTIEATPTGDSVTFIIPVEGSPQLFLVSVGRDIGLVRWTVDDPSEHTAKLSILVTVDHDRPNNRINDGKCDCKGRLYAGTKGVETEPGVIEEERGNLFVFSPDMEAKVCQDKIGLSNGLTWSLDRRTFYYIDTPTLCVDAFDYDEEKGVIGNRRKVVDYKSSGIPNDFPDGMTVDTDGNLWVANFCGAKIVCIDPKKGCIIRTIKLGINNPTCVAFGGADYSTMFVTSSYVGLTEQQRKEQPDSGAVLKITGLGVKGIPPHKAKLTKAMIAKAY